MNNDNDRPVRNQAVWPLGFTVVGLIFTFVSECIATANGGLTSLRVSLLLLSPLLAVSGIILMIIVRRRRRG